MLLLLTLACAERHTTETFEAVEVLTFRQEYTQSHLLRGPGGAVLVDAGLETRGPDLVASLEDAGVAISELTVVLTHGHADHAGGAGLLQAMGAEIWAGDGDAALLAGEEPELCPTDTQAERRLDKDSAASYAPIQADVWVGEEGLDLSSALGTESRVLSLPGHTHGSLVVSTPEVTLVGDMLRGTFVGERPTEHFYQCELEENHAQIRRLFETEAPEAARVFPGHFGPFDRQQVLDWLDEVQVAQAVQ